MENQMVKLFACGDIVNYNNAKGELLSDDLAQIIQSMDYSVCNFEAPIQGKGAPEPKSGIHHSQRAETLSGLKKQGFDLALLANNHMLDFGKDGLQATIDEAQRVGLDTVGAGIDEREAYKPLIKKIGDITIGIINACEAQFGVIDYFKRSESAGYAWINHTLIDKTVLKLKEECDFVLIFPHAGLENYSIPQKEWRERYKHLCDLGADAVIASHPHVPQGYEQYGKSLIFYSLGNFYFDPGKWAHRKNSSFSVILTMKKNNAINFEPVYHHMDQGKVEITQVDQRIDLHNLCSLLGEGYDQAHDEMVISAYPDVKKHLISSFFSIPIAFSFKSWTKELAATLLGRRKNTNKVLKGMHFTRNEAYYYVLRHGLELEAKQELNNE
ncbi:CapA family protein [Pseudoalteromonas sp.]|uniref:CapA family protein n=1 Tax=Pseudoalteromonas sp. TaxID=53249 RepID=UPI001BCCD21C|nr:CapA family protein [Pseudoalteromonas sp.]